MNPTNPTNPKTPSDWLWVDLPQTAYRQAWHLQQRIVARKIDGLFRPNIFLALEHTPVFTLGRRGGRENLCVSETILERAGIEIVAVERGGNITFHGPGQLVVYPIVDLKKEGIGVADLVDALESAMIRTAAAAGVHAGRNAMNRGVWVGSNKIGSVGIAVRRGISFHGLALNVDLDLKPFSWINPCGLSNIGITSLQNEGAVGSDMAWTRRQMRRQFERIFNTRCETRPPAFVTAPAADPPSSAAVLTTPHSPFSLEPS